MKRFIIILIALPALVLILFFAYNLYMLLEPTPNKNEVERMVHNKDLADFGKIEGSYLYTPNNYGFYDENRIYIVEQYFEEDKNYNSMYITIESGIEMTKEEQTAIEKIKQKPEIKDNLNQVQFPSKHKVTLFENDEAVQEEWFVKAIYIYEGDMRLKFLPLDYDQFTRFNFSAEGYKKFESF